MDKEALTDEQIEELLELLSNREASKIKVSLISALTGLVAAVGSIIVAIIDTIKED